jgi:phosphonate metabolism-associated iron-containing alcohol dehydrogenase
MNNNIQKVWILNESTKIISGPRCISILPDILESSKSILLITSKGFSSRGTVREIFEMLANRQVVLIDDVISNPDISYIEELIVKLQCYKFDYILALGGGSVIDVTKVLSLLLNKEVKSPIKEILDSHQTFITHNISAIKTAVIPTTSTGSEVTPFATIWDFNSRKKYSFENLKILPKVIFHDPVLCSSLPIKETLYTSLDCISHAFESIWNKNSTPLSVAFATKSLMIVDDVLIKLLLNPNSLEFRAAMQEASFLAGLAIAVTRTAIAHSISYPLTISYGIPHGLACSFTLPKLIGMYQAKVRLSQIESDLFSRVRNLLLKLNLSNELQSYISLTQLDPLVREMIHPGRLDNYIFDVDEFTIKSILMESTNACIV